MSAKPQKTLEFTEFINYVVVNGSPHSLRQLSVVLSYRVKGYQFSNKYQMGIWDGRIRFMKKYKNSGYVFPSGLFSRAIRFCIKENIDYKLLSSLANKFRFCKRIKKLSDTLDEHLLKDIVLRPYEVDMIKTALRMGIGILDVATAGGKSLIAAGIIKAIDRDTLFLTHKKDYLSEMEYILKSQFTDAMVGRVGGGIVRLSRIDVGSVQTISRNLKELGSYLGKKRVVIVDEAHFACSKSYSDVLAACTHAPWRFGLTASVEKQSVKMVGESQLGPIISTITPKYLIDKGFITPPKIIMFPIKKPKISFRLDYHSCYKEGIVENEFRNNKIVSIAKLLVKRNITPVVILCKMIRHHRNLAECLDYTSLKYEMLDGNHSTVEKDRVFGKLKRGESEVCLFTGIFDESMNVPNLKAVIFAGSGYSQKKSIQRIGRGMRLFKDKPYFVIVDFFDLTHSYLEKHSRIRSRTYKNLGYTSEIGPDINSYLDRWEKLHEKRFI